jgi:UDP-glucose 4-epimerase
LRDFDRAYGVRSIILRYFNAAGADPSGQIGELHDPETHLVPLALQAAAGVRDGVEIYGTDYPTPDGTCVRDYVHVADLAQAHLLSLRYLQSGRPSDAFNLGNGDGFSVRMVIETVQKVTGRKVRAIDTVRRFGDPHALVGSSVKARRLLGWNPKFRGLEAIVETAWKWHESSTR